MQKHFAITCVNLISIDTVLTKDWKRKSSLPSNDYDESSSVYDRVKMETKSSLVGFVGKKNRQDTSINDA